MMKKLSRYRRHKWAAPALMVVCLIGLGTTFSFAADVQPAQTTVATSQSTQVQEGKQIFLRGCSSCHGLNAEGSGIAPSLIGVGGAAVDFQVGTGRMPMADMSQQAIRKKPVYDAQQTAALAAYVASLAPGPDVVSDANLTWQRDGNAAQGGTLFRTNCAMCHNFAGQGGALSLGKYAPTLMGVDAKYIYEAMITGPQSMPKFSDKTLTPAEKLSIIKFVERANTEPALGGAALGRVGPVTEGLLVWTFGLGLLIGVSVWLASKAR
jgi:ubiquinol-cytochrome c reductase cytochrome c subunit